MRKLMTLVAILALALVAAAPAIAQVTEGFSEKSTKSGSASPSDKISNSGKNVNLCPTDQQVAQTGNVLNEQGVDQYNSILGSKTFPGDISFDGSSLTVTPSTTATCDQTIKQAAAAAPKAAPKAEAKAEAKAPEAKAGGAEAKAPAAKELPKTGGVAGTASSLLGLGAGALLVAGGLLMRRIIR